MYGPRGLFFSRLARLRARRQTGLYSCNVAEREERYGEMLLRREADGLIFLGHSMSKSVSAMMKRNQMAPIVNGCEYSPSLLLGVLQRTVTSPVSITLPHKLQIRSSTGAPPRPPSRS
jgi:hypothetical protein